MVCFMPLFVFAMVGEILILGAPLAGVVAMGGVVMVLLEKAYMGEDGVQLNSYLYSLYCSIIQ